jgi:hypothetical protein
VRKPNFLFIGPDKTGSSWMYCLLKQHPHCYVPVCKDIYFFDRYYHHGMDWYLTFFQDATAEHRAIGELSHHYLFSSTAAERIQTHFPDVKLITCLRHPVERSFSHYLYMIRSGRTQESFETALQNYPEILENSFYAPPLQTYFKHFPAAQIKVLWFEDLQRDAVLFAKELFTFLDIPFLLDLPYDQRVLAASQPRNFLVAKFLKQGANLAREMGLTGWVGRLKHSSLTQRLYLAYAPAERPQMQWETACYLLEVFRQDMERLEQLLQLDLAHWLRVEQIKSVQHPQAFIRDGSQLPHKTDLVPPIPTRTMP